MVDGAEEEEQTTGGGARARAVGASEVVVARFGEALDWTRAYRDRADFVVYAKSNRTRQPAGSVRLPNVGQESHTYLHHIVSHYDSLANWTVFTHGGSPSFGYHGHRRGGGHLNHGVSFSDYLVPQPHSLFVDTAAFSSQRGDSLFASSLRMSYLYTTDALASNETCPADPEQWSAWWDMGRFAQYVQRKVEAQGGMHVVDFFNRYVRPEGSGECRPSVLPTGRALRRDVGSDPREAARLLLRPFSARCRVTSTRGPASTSSGHGRVCCSVRARARCRHARAPSAASRTRWPSSTPYTSACFRSRRAVRSRRRPRRRRCRPP